MQIAGRPRGLPATSGPLLFQNRRDRTRTCNLRFWRPPEPGHRGVDQAPACDGMLHEEAAASGQGHGEPEPLGYARYACSGSTPSSAPTRGGRSTTATPWSRVGRMPTWSPALDGLGNLEVNVGQALRVGRLEVPIRAAGD